MDDEPYHATDQQSAAGVDVGSVLSEAAFPEKGSHIMRKLMLLVAAAVLAALPSIQVFAGRTVP